MKHLGNIRDRAEEYRQSLAVAKRTGFTVHIEKTLGSNSLSPKQLVIYRGWLDRERTIAEVRV